MEVTLQVTSVLVGIIKTQTEIQCPSIHLQKFPKQRQAGLQCLNVTQASHSTQNAL